uniref:Uncharacterized protein n=1 Tax=Rhizochromulina marina TaxID=1034831 RepID=A0A7S2SJS9_9STRA|mmetsp:Transcript_30922/g.89820  ORF Transcript_30922/g.89820 Transcript_30922/m.89820 type:complete len:119 (+) Transcript_30922:3-359(+)
MDEDDEEVDEEEEDEEEPTWEERDDGAGSKRDHQHGAPTMDLLGAVPKSRSREEPDNSPPEPSGGPREATVGVPLTRQDSDNADADFRRMFAKQQEDQDYQEMDEEAAFHRFQQDLLC